jgi:hypothetical protein
LVFDEGALAIGSVLPYPTNVPPVSWLNQLTKLLVEGTAEIEVLAPEQAVLPVADTTVGSADTRIALNVEFTQPLASVPLTE